MLAGFTSRYGDLFWVLGEPADRSRGVISLLLELAKSPPAQQTIRKQAGEAEYLASFTMEEQSFAHEVLEIGRASTKAVVVSCILVLFADYVLSALMLPT